MSPHAGSRSRHRARHDAWRARSDQSKHRPIGRDCTDRPRHGASARCGLIDVAELKKICRPGVKSWPSFSAVPALAALCDDVGPCCALASSKTTKDIVAATNAANSRVAEPQIAQSFAAVAGKPHSSNQSGKHGIQHRTRWPRLLLSATLPASASERLRQQKKRS